MGIYFELFLDFAKMQKTWNFFHNLHNCFTKVICSLVYNPMFIKSSMIADTLCILVQGSGNRLNYSLPF